MDGFLLVDDRDAAVLAELHDVSKAFRILDELRRESPDLAEALCLVRFDRHEGALLGTATTTRIRPLI